MSRSPSSVRSGTTCWIDVLAPERTSASPPVAYEAVDHLDVPEEQSRLHRANRVLTDDRRGPPDVDAWQARGTLKQGLGRDVDTRTNDAAEVFPLRRDRVERGGRSKIDDDERDTLVAPELLPRRHGIDQAIGADIVRRRIAH